MTTYYVGIGGDDGNNGTTWALRKATLNGAEDIPVSAGDTVYVGPGTYRETLTIDVNGSNGSPITYIGDVTGAHTNGVGGVVRITGSDNDQTDTRATAINCDAQDYRTFTGFRIDMCSGVAVAMSEAEHCILEDCALVDLDTGVSLSVVNADSCTIRRCYIAFYDDCAISSYDGSSQAGDAGHVIENCIIGPGGNWTSGIRFYQGGGATVRNCLLFGVYKAIESTNTGAAQVDVNNCILCSVIEALKAAVEGDIVEDYNTLWGNATDRSNVAVGAHSVAYHSGLDAPLLQWPMMRAPLFYGLAPWSPVKALAGTSEPSDDLYGRTRPQISGKRSWGPVQYQPIEHEASRTYDSSTASLKLSDAGRAAFVAPVTTAEITLTVQVCRQTNYAGTAPQVIVRQDGQSDITVLDEGSASTWNAVSTAFTPADKPDYVVIELVSSNTYATAGGSIATYFDAISVT